ncbi:MAG: hypothetical protein NVS2B16_08790 [Chloroflexota bacterium]
MDAEQTLRNVPLFQAMQNKHLRSLAKGITTRNYAVGQNIVSQGQVGYGLYIIQEGMVRVSQESASGAHDLRTMGPGETFGELSLLDDQPRSATVTAIEPTTALLLDKWQFVSELKEHPEIAVSMLPILAQWLRSVEMP